MIRPLSPAFAGSVAGIPALILAAWSLGCSSEPVPTASAGCHVTVSASPDAGADCPSKGCKGTVAFPRSDGTSYAVCTELCTVGGATVCAQDEACFSLTAGKDGFCALRCNAAACKAPLTCRAGDVCY